MKEDTAERRAAAARKRSSRDPWLDNAKMALVTLVVVGHSWVLLPDSWQADGLYHFLYVWHVPAFVFITGYLSRSFDWTRPRMRALFMTVLVPYFVFEAAMAAFRIFVGGEELDMLFADPHWPLWYLSALFVWRLVTPLFKTSRWALLVAVAISLLGGLIGGEYLDLDRAMGLLPFFVLGLHARPEHLVALRQPRFRVLGAAALVVILVAGVTLQDQVSMELLYWRAEYAELGVSAWQGIAMRSALMVVATITALGFLALVPATGSWFTRLGPATLVVYLYHGFVVKGLEYTPAFAWADDAVYLGLLVVTTGAVLLSLLLAAPPVAKVLNIGVDPLGELERNVNPLDWPDERLNGREEPRPGGPQWPGVIR